jgi:hypothetical protein
VTYPLWTAQVLLALVYLFSGSYKLFAPLELLTPQLPLPDAVIRCLGLAEILGALGLILPSLLRVRPLLTPLAAACLVIIMIGATVCSVLWGYGIGALLPFVLGLLAAFVAYGRWRLAPQRGASRPAALQTSRQPR